MNNYVTSHFTSWNELLNLSGIKKTDPRDGERVVYIQAAAKGVSPGEWVHQNRDELRALLNLDKPILLRGFDMTEDYSLYLATRDLLGELENQYGDLPPSSSLADYVFQSTPYPPDRAILFHNEGAHWISWPRFIVFCCQQPATEGGETPLSPTILSGTGFLADIAPKLKKEGLIYRRMFMPGVDVAWQKFFKTSDPRIVEALCEKNGISLKWINRSQLQTELHLPAVYGDENHQEHLFHQILLFHPCCLGEAIGASSQMIYASGEEPRSVRYGNGDDIEPGLIQTLLTEMIDRSFCFDWQQGDLLIVDNLKYMHSRRPYRGPRSIKVLMSRFNVNYLNNLA